jgi:hypothetical protein
MANTVWKKGILKSKSKKWVTLKIFYLILILPFILFAVGLAGKSGFGSGKEEPGITTRFLTHFAAWFWSFCLWGIALNAIHEHFTK